MRNPEPEARAEETLDSFYHGRIHILQKKRGYRFSIDAPLLADFIQPGPADELLELGAGVGVISLLLSLKPFRRIVCLEIQPALAELARRNIRLNGLEEKITVLEQDLRAFVPEEKFDIVFSNPPHIRSRSGQLSRSEEKSVAKHEILCSISDIMSATRTCLKPEGRAYFIYPAGRRTDFDEAAVKNGLRLRAVRHVHPACGRPPRWFLAECGFEAAAAIVRPPLFVYDERGRYTEEMNRIFSGGSVGPSFP